MGLQLGAAFRYNTGTLATLTESNSGRNLPIHGDPFTFAGVTERWIAEGAVGSFKNPSSNQFDVRAQYKLRFSRGLGAEVFADIFNLFNNQDSIRNQDVVAGAGGTAFGAPIRFQDPRRFYLGARLTF